MRARMDFSIINVACYINKKGCHTTNSKGIF